MSRAQDFSRASQPIDRKNRAESAVVGAEPVWDTYPRRFGAQSSDRFERARDLVSPMPSPHQVTSSQPQVVRPDKVSRDFYTVRGSAITTCAADLITAIRDHAAARLHDTSGIDSQQIEHSLIGRRPGSARPRAINTARVQIAMLTDTADTDVLVVVPDTLPRQFRNVFSFLSIAPGTHLEPCSRSSELATMYGLHPAPPARVWQSTTPVALPGPSQTLIDRLDPHALRRSVHTALRHANIDVRVVRAWTPRDAFSGHHPLEHHASARFSTERLCHLGIELARPIAGPLLLGDGRYVGLGLMRPLQAERPWDVLFSATIEAGLTPAANALVITRALRRAVLSRVQHTLGHGRRLPTLVSGHELDGSPAQGHKHVHYLFDPPRSRVLLVAPNALGCADLLRRALLDFRELRAGPAGCLRLEPVAPDLAHDSVLGCASRWKTLTPYTVNTHHRLADPRHAVAKDIRDTCGAAGLPTPDVVVGRIVRDAAGLTAELELRFSERIQGPLILGRTRHKGGGLFSADVAKTKQTGQRSRTQR